MDAVFNQVLASVIVGILSWTGGQLISRWTKRNAAATSATTQPQPPPQAPVAAYTPPVAHGAAATAAGPAQINIGQVLMHIAILQFAVNIVGLVIGLVVGFIGGVFGGASDSVLGVIELLILLFGTLVAIVLFCYFGLRVHKSVRWAHLMYVAIGTIPLTLLVNAIGLQRAPNLLTIIGAAVQTFVAMGLGGACAMLLAPKPAPAMPAPVPTPAGGYYGPGGPYSQYGQQAAPAPHSPYGPPPGSPDWQGHAPTPNYPPYPPYPAQGHDPASNPYGHPGVHGTSAPQSPPAGSGAPPEGHQPGWHGQGPGMPAQPPRDG